jgi:hypothetical protein
MRPPRIWCAVLLGVAAWTCASQAIPAETAAEKTVWLTDYVHAMDVANEQGKMLLIFFHDPANEWSRRLETEVLGNPAVQAKLQEFVCAKLPLDCRATVGGEEIVLLRHSSFREMLGQPGIAILDFGDTTGKLPGRLVSNFPVCPRLTYTPEQMLVILGLPRGTITQRTLVYAVRIHPERPASTAGQAEPRLMEEAEKHSAYQAAIRLQGHHRWETRFHLINALLPRGLMAKEVCAESWPGQNLVESAIECVRCWRCSQGHWNAVRTYHQLYGYDMKCGSNGVWYATGIFGCQ